MEDKVKKIVHEELREIKEAIRDLEDRFNTNLRLTDQGLQSKIKVSHNEQMNKLDSIVKMLETDDEERIIMGGQIDELREEVESLKKIHPKFNHATI